jgi:hypothetical protein
MSEERITSQLPPTPPLPAQPATGITPLCPPALGQAPASCSRAASQRPLV